MENILNKLRLPYREDTLYGILFLFAFIAPLAFNPWLLEGYETTRFALTLILTGAAVLVAVYNNKKISITWLSIFCVGFLLINILSLITSKDVVISLFGLYGRFTGSILFLICWLVMIFLFASIKDFGKYKTIYKMLVVSGSLVSVLGILHSFGIGFYAGPDSGARPIVPGFIGNQNFAAMYLLGIFPLLLPLFTESKNFYTKIYYALTGLFMVWAVMVFASRGAILALAGALLFGLGLLLIRKTSWLSRLIVAVVLIISVVFGFLFYSTTRYENTAETFTSQEVSAQTRLVVWTKSVELIKQYWYLGLGPGNFFIGFKTFGDNILPSNERFDDAHNLYLQLASTIGIFGLLLFLVILSIGFYITLKHYWKTQDLWSWGFCLAFIGLAISYTFNPVSLPNWILLAVLIGIVSGNYLDDIRALSIQNKFLKLFIIVCSALLISAGIGFYGSELFATATVHAYRANQIESAKKYGKAALILNPFNNTARAYYTASLIKTNYDHQKIRGYIEDFYKYHKLSSGNQKNTADLYFMLYRKTNDQADLDNSLKHLETSLQLEPNYSQLLINSGYLLYQAGKIDEAELKLKQAVGLSSQGKFFYAELLLAQINLDHGKFDQALWYLDQANNIQPNILLKKAQEDIKSKKLPNNKLPIYLPDVDI